jgi:hypothetical protein
VVSIVELSPRVGAVVKDDVKFALVEIGMLKQFKVKEGGLSNIVT